MTAPDWTKLPLQGDERSTLLAFLAFYRESLLDRAAGLDHEQHQIALTASGLTMTRLIGHMAWVEEIWFSVRFDGEDFRPPFHELDFDADPDAEMTLSQTWPVDELLSVFHDAVADADRRIAAAESLDQLSTNANREGEHWSLRWIIIHMIEEYARHCGHADLIRESIDGGLAE